MLDDARGWRLAEMRKRRGLTQEQVAARMGISVARVSQIESGDVSTQDVLNRFIAALGGTLKLIADFGDEQLKIALLGAGTSPAPTPSSPGRKNRRRGSLQLAEPATWGGASAWPARIRRLRACGIPTESPQLGIRNVVPHRFPQTKRHTSMYDGTAG
jgi:transcriptional regulator with XRE-family HTH domain